MIYVLIFFLSLTLTIFSLPYVISFLTKLDIVDKPGGRKLHTEPTPRMGGIVIFAVTAVVLISFVPDLHMIRLVLISSSLLLVCGMVDDKRGLDWKKKFILQFAAAGFCCHVPCTDVRQHKSLYFRYPHSLELYTPYCLHCGRG